MTSLTYALGDSATMLRRNLRRAVRYPALTVIVAAMPVVLLLLFVFVFGGTLGAGLGGRGRGTRGVRQLRDSRHPDHRRSPARPRGRRSPSPWT